MEKPISSRAFHKYLFACLVFFLESFSQIGGVVVDNQGQPVEGALVGLVLQGLTSTTDVNGNWALAVTSILSQDKKGFKIKNSGHEAVFRVENNSTQLIAKLLKPNNSLVKEIFRAKLNQGIYSLAPFSKELEPGMYVLQMELGQHIYNLPMIMVKGFESPTAALTSSPEKEKLLLSKKGAALDTLRVSKTGYETSTLALEAFNSNPITVVLNPRQASSYELPPPDPCANQFFVEGCNWDDPNSTCGGVCAVANSCSPPETQDKSNLEKTFICPRFMMYSTEMEQAASDDAARYSWGNPQDPPFTYGIVGHDADVGGLDDIESSCCQCYQLIFESPEPGSPQIGELSYPKSMVVQSFNTAASGPKGFDLFMGAGGYGAFNSCYNDPNFGNTTQFNEFMYDSYPYQNPGSGGISFLRYSECESGSWPQTISGVESQICQDKIAEQCNQALISASPEGTESTIQSCIKTNRSTSLYHQNWQVKAKRVQCPEALTRVTGCRLLEPNLPMPLPEVQTPAQADANGTFSSGYHTTTMQDCCKPTCAWKDWVTDKGLPADGDWNSFYSCNKDGVPLTQ